MLMQTINKLTGSTTSPDTRRQQLHEQPTCSRRTYKTFPPAVIWRLYPSSPAYHLWQSAGWIAFARYSLSSAYLSFFFCDTSRHNLTGACKKHHIFHALLIPHNSLLWIYFSHSRSPLSAWRASDVTLPFFRTQYCSQRLVAYVTRHTHSFHSFPS